MATSDDEQAVSMAMFGPVKSSRYAMRADNMEQVLPMSDCAEAALFAELRTFR